MHWPWWLSGLALALLPILHWSLLKRPLAVSGRFTALIDRLRFGAPAEPPPDMATLLEALRGETEREFGIAAPAQPLPIATSTTPPPPEQPAAHGLFLAGLVLGGVASAWLAGAGPMTHALSGLGFARIAAELRVSPPVLLGLGGFMVGFGARMAGGCTSGHGLCGVSQLQAGSLLATVAFFAAGVGTSFALSALL